MYKWMLMLLCAVMLSACDKPAAEQTTTAEPTKPTVTKEETAPAVEEVPKVELNEQERTEIKQAATSEAATITADNAAQEADKLAKEIEADL